MDGPYFDEDGEKEMEIQMKATAGLLLGRKTFDIFAGYSPDHTENGLPQVNKITKYVVSKTLKNPTWDNTVVIKNINNLSRYQVLTSSTSANHTPPPGTTTSKHLNGDKDSNPRPYNLKNISL